MLSPAGNFETLNAAVSSGADAVYLGLKEFSARAFAGNFNLSDIPGIVDALGSINIKVYVALNTVVKENELSSLVKSLSYLNAIPVDAVIVQDFALIEIIHRYFPDLKIHASTQMSNINSFDLEFLKKHNVKRAVLDRHLTFDEIKSITEKSSVEIEIFVHGALCYSFSGQCIFSSFLGGQSANRGRCTQPCRRNYILNKKKTGFFFSPNDLSLVKGLEKFLKINVSSFKIEGRMKSSRYVSNVTKAYRILMDYYNTNGKIDESVIIEADSLVKKSFGRKTSSGYYFFPDTTVVEPKLAGATGVFAGKAFETSHDFLKFKTRVELEIGDRIRVQEIRESFNIKKIYSLKGNFLKKAEKNSIVLIPFEKKIKIKKGNLIFKVSGKDDSCKKLKIKKISANPEPIRMDRLNDSPKGKSEYYLKLGDLKQIWGLPDFFKDYLIIPAQNPDNLKQVRAKVKKFHDNMVFEVPPFLFEKDLEKFSGIIDSLVNLGFKKFFLNSKSQLLFFEKYKSENIFLIASERFHVANSYSAFFLKKAGFKRYVTDIENSKENLNAISLKSDAIVMLYSKYPLLVSRFPNGVKNNSLLEDNKKKRFSFKIEKGLQYIYSNETFNICSRINELKGIGYNKFLFDISNLKTFNKSIKSFYNALKYGKIKSINEFNYNFNID